MATRRRGLLGGGPSHLSIVYEPNHHRDEAFRSAIAKGARQHHWGFGDMPPVGGLSDDDVETIIAFVRDTQAQQGFENPLLCSRHTFGSE